MAVTQNNLIGRARGSAGNITFATWKGLNIMKNKAVNAYSNPTEEQLSNNSKFGTLVAFARQIPNIIRSGFRALAVGKTEYNAFMSVNKISAVVAGIFPNYYVDPGLIAISQGPEPQYGLAGAVKQAPIADMVSIDWNPQAGEPGTAPVYGAAFNTATGELVALNTPGDLLGSQSTQFEAPNIGTNIATHTFHVFYVNPVTGKACDSVIV